MLGNQSNRKDISAQAATSRFVTSRFVRCDILLGKFEAAESAPNWIITGRLVLLKVEQRLLNATETAPGSPASSAVRWRVLSSDAQAANGTVIVGVILSRRIHRWWPCWLNWRVLWPDANIDQVLTRRNFRNGRWTWIYNAGTFRFAIRTNELVWWQGWEVIWLLRADPWKINFMFLSRARLRFLLRLLVPATIHVPRVAAVRASSRFP